jgi:hypothetical protein
MSENKPPFVIHVDGQEFKVDQTTMSGADIKRLAGKDATYQLFLEGKGNEPDQVIPDSRSVAVQNGLHFYAIPAATFGSYGSSRRTV